MVKIAFRYGTYSILDMLVSLFTWSKFSHAELVINNIWFSSTMKDGVRHTYNRDKQAKWKYIEIKATPEQIAALVNFYFENKGKKYDFTNLLMYIFLPFRIKNKTYFCFEYVYEALESVGILSKLHKNKKITANTILRALRGIK